MNILLSSIFSLILLTSCAEIEIVKSMTMGAFSGKKYTQAENLAHYKVGQPYQIFGKWYYPKVDRYYQETGMASWYGPKFHKRPTANGEVFNKHIISAAHRTLPLPSIVRVTNLENGRELTLRVNDRGPFAHDRIIDLSEKAAKKLGMHHKGTAKVKVVLDRKATAKLFGKKNWLAKNNRSKQSAPKIYDVNILPNNAVTLHRATAKSGHFIQVGAFNQNQSAVKVADNMKKFGNVFIEGVTFEGNTLYRVKIGPFNRRNSAELTLNKITKSGYKDAIIVEG